MPKPGSPNGASPSHFKLIKAGELHKLPPVELLKGTHLVARGFNVIFGPSGTYKSFYALNAALHLAQKLGVIYVAAEGIGGMATRVDAWCEFNQTGPGYLQFISEELNLLDGPQITRFVDTAKTINAPIVLVILDTYARCMPGGDENSAKDAGLAIRHCAAIQRSLKTALAVVHHSNRAETGERGSGALRGAADAMIEVSALDDRIRVECSKMKDWESWPAEFYRFQPVSKSGLLLPADDVHLPDQIGNKEVKILEALNLDIFETSGATAQQIVDSTGLSRPIIFRLLSKLKANDLVHQDKRGNPFSLTPNGRKALRVAHPGAKTAGFNVIIDTVN